MSIVSNAAQQHLLELIPVAFATAMHWNGKRTETTDGWMDGWMEGRKEGERKTM